MKIKQKGILLVEILVALVISIFLLGGVVQVYIANKTSYRFSDASSHIQENARFSLELISSDLRMAGYWGCTQFYSKDQGKIRNNLNTSSPNYKADFHNIIDGDAISITVNDGLNGSDGLRIIGSKPSQNIIRAPYVTNNQENFEVLEMSAIMKNDIVIISDCESADIFEVTAVTASPVNGQNIIAHSTAAQTHTPGNMNGSGCAAEGTGHCLKGIYGLSGGNPSTASISVLQTVSYFIKNSAEGEPSLWRTTKIINNTIDAVLTEEDDLLIEGVEEMQILFGIDTDDDGIPNQYVADTDALAADSVHISSVRVFLVVRSEADNITDSAQIYNLNGVDITATDNRLRHVFSITVALRNR